MGAFWNYLKLKNQAEEQPQQPQQQAQQPQIDTSDPINSLASQLVTPAEREAAEQKMLKNKRRMIAWTGLFDGLRNLANLYAVSQGASNQKYTDNPYATIEQGYQQERQRANSQFDYRDKYANTLYNLNRQSDQDKMRKESHKAQLKWYDTRDEIARLKEERDKLKAEADLRQKDERTRQIQEKTEQLRKLFPLKEQKEKASIQNILHNANRPYGRGGGGRRSSSTSSNDPYVELATQLNENPDVIGPILEQEGLGFYNRDTKEFSFVKNPTKGMVTTANKRASQRGSSGRRGSLLPGGGNGKSTKQGGSLLPK